MPPPGFDDLRRFLAIDGWEELERIPGWVVAGLLRAGMGEDEISKLDAVEARNRLEEVWSHPLETAE